MEFKKKENAAKLPGNDGFVWVGGPAGLWGVEYKP
jgi:hypothetical protein